MFNMSLIINGNVQLSSVPITNNTRYYTSLGDSVTLRLLRTVHSRVHKRYTVVPNTVTHNISAKGLKGDKVPSALGNALALHYRKKTKSLR